MTQNNLEASLESLHKNLAESSTLDSPTREKLKGLMDEIQLVLEKADSSLAASPQHGTLAQRFNDLVEDFESHHPQLTANLSIIAERLADMGI